MKTPAGRVKAVALIGENALPWQPDVPAVKPQYFQQTILF